MPGEKTGIAVVPENSCGPNPPGDPNWVKTPPPLMLLKKRTVPKSNEAPFCIPFVTGVVKEKMLAGEDTGLLSS